jgi:hypothetical protein
LKLFEKPFVDLRRRSFLLTCFIGSYHPDRHRYIMSQRLMNVIIKIFALQSIRRRVMMMMNSEEPIEKMKRKGK